jgi:hypothetical protein
MRIDESARQFLQQKNQRICAAERRQNVQMIGQGIETRGN